MRRGSWRSRSRCSGGDPGRPGAARCVTGRLRCASFPAAALLTLSLLLPAVAAQEMPVAEFAHLSKLPCRMSALSTADGGALADINASVMAGEYEAAIEAGEGLWLEASLRIAAEFQQAPPTERGDIHGHTETREETEAREAGERSDRAASRRGFLQQYVSSTPGILTVSHAGFAAGPELAEVMVAAAWATDNPGIARQWLIRADALFGGDDRLLACFAYVDSHPSNGGALLARARDTMNWDSPWLRRIAQHIRP